MSLPYRCSPRAGRESIPPPVRSIPKPGPPPPNSHRRTPPAHRHAQRQHQRPTEQNRPTAPARRLERQPPAGVAPSAARIPNSRVISRNVAVRLDAKPKATIASENPPNNASSHTSARRTVARPFPPCFQRDLCNSGLNEGKVARSSCGGRAGYLSARNLGAAGEVK